GDAEELKPVENFLRQTPRSVEKVFLAINQETDSAVAANYFRDLNLPRVEVVRIGFGGRFTPTLNHLVFAAAQAGFSHLLFCSPEVELTDELLKRLLVQLDHDTLVAGAVLSGHDFRNGTATGSGVTIPWNTLAVWNLRYLALTGFMLVADGIFDRAAAGVEELSTGCILQSLYPKLKIKLVDLGKVKWSIGRLGDERIAAHIKKLASKQERGQKQLELLGLAAPQVLHVIG
ncbi:MAG: hypothetical protein HY397_03635, partial [Candidatus Doudnabacteria bacterium]|nr:hypothetical protein [Candidatus Doudnabacteria bacterium]